MKSKVVYLDISTWRGRSIGATHYYAELHPSNRYGWNSTDESVNLYRTLTAKTAREENDKSGRKFMSKGDEARGWNSKNAIRKYALKEYKKLYPEAEFLLEGRITSLEPVRCLDCPIEFKERLDLIYAEYERLDKRWNNVSAKQRKSIEDKIDVLTDEFEDILQSFINQYVIDCKQKEKNNGSR